MNPTPQAKLAMSVVKDIITEQQNCTHIFVEYKGGWFCKKCGVARGRSLFINLEVL